MLHQVIHLLVSAVAVLLAAKLVPGIRVRSFGSAFFFAFVLALFNWLLFTVLVVMSFPFVVLSLGLFIFVINAFIFWLADKFVDGVKVDGFFSCLFGSALTSLFTTVIAWAFSIR